jgi:6-phosphogluconolactonase
MEFSTVIVDGRSGKGPLLIRMHDRTSAELDGSSCRVCVSRDQRELAERAAAHIATAAVEAVAARGQFTLCLSGGDTPIGTYRRLAGDAGRTIPWNKVHVFWGDERCIPLGRPDNHYTMASELLLSRVPIPPENVHRARGEAADPAAAASEYEGELRTFFAPAPSEFPQFDLILLGMGEDGHVASIFPGSAGWQERGRWVVDHYLIKRGERVRRLTLTMPVLTAAREVMLLVSGDLKANALASVLRGTFEAPAAELNATASRIRWMVDRDAASSWEPAEPISRGELR